MKKNLKSQLFVLVASLVLTFSSANAESSVTTLSSGSGVTKDDAVQSALRKAVESVAGVFVFSFSEVKDLALVKDKIITASKGYIKGYDIVTETQSDGGIFVTLSVTVDTAGINATISRSLKLTTYEDTLKDYATLTSIVDRNKKMAEILKSISSRPLDELYLLDFAGYEIVDAGTSSADVMLKFRVSQNPYLWDIYYDALKHVTRLQKFSNDNYTIARYKVETEHSWGYELLAEKLYLNPDYNSVLVKPKKSKLQLQLVERTYEVGPFCFYDKYMGNDREGRCDRVAPYVTAYKTTNKDSEGYFLGHSGFEYRVLLKLDDLADIKKLLSVKVSFKDESKKQNKLSSWWEKLIPIPE